MNNVIQGLVWDNAQGYLRFHLSGNYSWIYVPEVKANRLAQVITNCLLFGPDIWTLWTVKEGSRHRDARREAGF